MGVHTARLRASFYADDAAIFINPIEPDVVAVQGMLKLFGDASGLRTNIQKCVAYPISCQGIDLQQILSSFGGETGLLPCKYLGLPLGLRKPTRAELQPILDKIAGTLKSWKGKLMDRAARLRLVNSVITSMAAYHLAAFPADKWFIKKIDKLRRGFVWAAEEEAKGGQCLVNWKAVCAPKKYGGLGIKDISAFSRSLRLRWLWLQWDASDRPWKGMDLPCDAADKALFYACSKISIGNGELASFWNDSWLAGCSPAAIAPSLFKLAFRKNYSVKEGLHLGRWMRGLHRMTTIQELEDLAHLWNLIQNVQLVNTADKLVWNMTADGVYTAKSSYEAQFLGRIRLPNLELIWKAKLEDKVRFFLWLLLQNRLWTADRLRARGWNHDSKCCLCATVLEDAEHLFLHCPYAIKLWDEFATDDARMVGIALLPHGVEQWWQKLLTGPRDAVKRDITTAGYIVWNIWKERNRRIFQKVHLSPTSVASLAKSEVAMFGMAHRSV